MQPNYKILLFFLFSIGLAHGQKMRLQKGMVNEGIAISDSLQDTYALFIPSNFDPKTPNKILYVFDPMGDGVRAARLFMTALPTDDFVIATNQFPLTDDLESNMNKIIKLIENTSSIIKMNPQQIYVAGLDEGARVASGLTYLVTNLAGVLLVNDVFMRYDLQPKKKNEIVLGLTGNASPNYYKMQSAFDRLQFMNKDDKLFEYDGEDGWPRLDYLGTVFSTLYFLRQDADNKELVDELVEHSFKKDSTTVDALVARQDYRIAYKLIGQLKDKYRGLMKLRPLRKQIQQLRRNKGYRDERNRINDDAEDEAILLDDLNYFLDNDLFLADFENLGYWNDRVTQFKKAEENPSKPYEQQVAKRMLGFIKNSLNEYGQNMNSTVMSADQLIFFYVLKTVVNPKDYAAYRKVISLAAKDNDDNTAYFYLEEMLKNGYKDYDALYTIPETEVIRISPVFNKIVKKYFDKSKYQ